MPYLQGKTKLPPDDELIPFTQALEDGPFTSVFPLFGGWVPCTMYCLGNPLLYINPALHLHF